MPREIKFLSQNPHKLKEAQAILSVTGVTVAPVQAKIDEIQTQDPDRLVHDKALKAFDRIRRPLFVEHTGLYLASLNDLPGGLTQTFWDKLQADRFAELFGKAKDPRATARTSIAYLDGRRIHIFHGEISGRIAEEPRGNRDFQWDCVFVPDGHAKTFAELGAVKNEISMRRKALDTFAEHLKKERRT